MISPPIDEIGTVERDHSVTSQEIRDAVDAAIEICDHLYSEVHIARLREHLPEWATGPQIGARITGHVRRGSLEWTGAYAANGNRGTRNALRPAKVYRLVKALVDGETK